MRMNKRKSKFSQLPQSFAEGMEHLEPRTMLSGEVGSTTRDFSGSVIDWHGAHMTNWSRGSWIVTFDTEQSRVQAEARARQVATALGINAVQVEASPLGHFARIQTPSVVSEAAVSAAVQQFGFLHNVQPDLLSTTSRLPNDATFAQQWPLRNIGQAADSSGNGTIGADMSAAQAWDITTGSRQVVAAILDTGINITHPDLRANLWTNAGEIAGNNTDDDGNGFVDDINGWDFVGNGQGNGDNNPDDPATQGHGTAVAGCVGAVGNNALGVAGVNWQVQMIACKIFPDNGNSPQSAQIGALEYCILMKRRGVNIVVSSNSYGSLQDEADAQFNDAIRIAIANYTDAGMIFVAAAGNDTNDNDSTTRAYPASYDNPFIVSAAATDNKDQIATFSNFGRTTVDVGAPGVRVWTTATGGGYQYIDGTSFACPYTAGVIALMASVNQFATKEQLKAGLYASVDPIPALTDKVVTGGRINAFKAVRASRTEGLFVTTISPGTQSANVTQIDVVFSGDINPAFFDSNIALDLRLQRANGASSFNGSEIDIPILASQVKLNGQSVPFASGGNHLTITFAVPLPRDLYRLTLRADHFRDNDGNYLNGDETQGNDEVYDFSVISFRGPYEPNDTRQTAAPILLDPSGNATLEDLFIGDGINVTTDVDIFKIYVSGPSLISLAVLARSLPVYSGLDSYLRIFDSGGVEIAHNDNFDGLDSKLQVFVGGAGDFYIAISAFPNTSYLPDTENGRTANGSSGVYSLDVSVATSGPQVITRTGTAPVGIPVLGDITSTINVTDGRSITDLTIALSLTHTFDSDLLITLTGPGGDSIILFNRRGGSGHNLTTTVFSDDASTAIAAGSAPFTGTFLPEQALTPFKNRSAQGTWTLRIQDLKPLDSGTLDAWSMTFTHVNDVSGPNELNDTTLLATATGIDTTGAKTFEAFVGDGAFGLRDVDLYHFVAGAGTTITINSSVTAGSVKTVLRLFDVLGNEIRADRRHGVTTNLLNFVVASAGTYYVGVSGGSNSSNPGDLGNDNYAPATGGSGSTSDATGNYTLTISVAGGISEGPQLISGNHLSLGVNSNGAIGLPAGTSTKGLSLDGLDFLLSSGAISSYFGAIFDGFVVRNTGDRSQTDLPMALSNESDYANRRVVASGVFRGLGVRRSISFGVNDQFIAIDVSLTNRSTLVMNNVAWLEGVGARQGLNLPVIDPQTQGLTVNNVRNGSGRLATSSFASGGSNYTLGLGAAAGAYNVVTGFTAPGVARDPFALLTSPNDPDTSMADAGTAGLADMSVAYNIGVLGPTQTITFRYFLFAGSTATAVNGMFDQVEAGTGAGHLVADPKASAIDGASLPYTLFYPEGYANNRANSFLPIVNGGSTPVRVVVIAHYEKSGIYNLPVSEVLYDSATDETGGVIPANYRGGITLTNPANYAAGTNAGGGLPGRVASLITGRNGVFKDTPYSLEIRSSAPIGAEFSHYDFGITTGVAAISTQSTTWTFAQVAKTSTQADVVVFTNPGTVTTKVTLTFFGASGQVAQTFTQNVEAGRRGGWSVSALNIPDGTYAARLDSEQPIVAALTHYDIGAGNGYGTTGLPSAGSTTGGTSQGQVGLTATSESVRVLNTNSTPATVTFTFAFANSSSYRRTLVVPAKSSGGFKVSSLVGFPVGQAYSVLYDATLPVTVSLPNQTSLGSSGSTLTSSASTQWLFGDGFRPASGNAVKEFLRVFNPSVTDQTIEIGINYNDGTSEVFRRTIPARATANYDVFDFITGTHASPGTVPGVGSFYGVRVAAAVPVVAFLGHFDAFLGGGFGSLGTPLGTTGSPM
jgi:subtilisin family serine protease/subtilisin-like proprotein convertase family protein